MTEHTLRESPLHAEHENLGASFTAFGPWNMPLKYDSELAEHKAVREAAGLFDLSHMGEVRVTGPEAGAFLDHALISQLSSIAIGRAKYSMIVNEQGGIIDDLITYRLGENEFLVVPNAGNTTAVVAALQERAEGFDVVVGDESLVTALIAVQGPKSLEILLSLTAEEDVEDVREAKYYSAVQANIAGVDMLVARTGYTGEDGFELYISNTEAPALWNKLLDAGAGQGLLPCGLAARDSLRLEAGMPLYGNELSLDLTPKDAGLGVLIGKKKESFFGKEALDAQAEPARVLVGLSSEGRRAARSGAQLFDAAGTEVGQITSGQPSPTLGYPVALAYVDREFGETGTALEADIRGKRYPFTVVDTPFYKRAQ
ncbi:Aminomethyltransferase [Corynebacterium occultum]|uniref:Aminomethyltransferase n=1 Tax=Corynebacterium occultum TaxID=2675219 RepID=A0A6B8W7E7_9CORY|nr:glycine cleavage system aminomethyltransferase GcvT [Corynebacterium occultum]QGU07847.1 Aminomethyltransferase [Corynebacterium occultum]